MFIMIKMCMHYEYYYTDIEINIEFYYIGYSCPGVKHPNGDSADTGETRQRLFGPVHQSNHINVIFSDGFLFVHLG